MVFFFFFLFSPWFWLGCKTWFCFSLHAFTPSFCNFVSFSLAICYVPLFRSLTDGNCLYSVISVRLVENNSLIHLLRILISLELFLNHEFYSKHPDLTDVYSNDKAVPGEKLFWFFESVFELVRRLRDSQTSTNNKDLGPRTTCKERVWEYMQRQRSSFSCVLALKRKWMTFF